MRWLVPLLLVGCAKTGGPTAAADPVCTQRDYLREALGDEEYAVGLVLGTRDAEVVSCLTSELPGQVGVGFALPEARISYRTWSSIDSGLFTMRVAGVPRDFDVDLAMHAFVSQALPAEDVAEERAKRLEIPRSWALHPDSPNADEARAVAWWTPVPGAAGKTLRRQAPAELAPCGGRASGSLAHFDGESLFLHAWTTQHFSPEGGCGG